MFNYCFDNIRDNEILVLNILANVLLPLNIISVLVSRNEISFALCTKFWIQKSIYLNTNYCVSQKKTAKSTELYFSVFTLKQTII